MKEFTLLRNYFKIFDDHLDKKFESMMTDHLNITDDEKEQIVRESIMGYFTLTKMCKHINYALRKSGKYHRYEVTCTEFIDEYGEIVRIQYNKDKFLTSRFDNGEIFHRYKDYMVSVDPIGVEIFKEKFYEWARPYFIQRTDSVMKQIIFHWCEILEKEKGTNIIQDSYIIKGDYEDLVDMYNYLINI